MSIAKYELLTSPAGKQNNTFTPKMLVSKPTLNKHYGKVGLFEFNSPNYLSRFDHVKLKRYDINKTVFGGLIVKLISSKNDVYRYVAHDYKWYLNTEVDYAAKGVTGGEVVRYLLKNHVNNGGKRLKYSKKSVKTNNVYDSLGWENETILGIINQLIYLEWKKAKTKLILYVDPNANMYFLPIEDFASKLDVPVISDCIDFQITNDYSGIKTGYIAYDDSGNILKQAVNKSLSNLAGNILASSTAQTESDYENYFDDKGASSDKKIKKIVEKINKSMRGIKHRYNGGPMDCYEMSEAIFKKLKAHKVPCKVPQYYSANSNSKTHRSVIIHYSTGWKNFDYKGMEPGFGPNWRSLKSSTWEFVKYKYP